MNPRQSIIHQTKMSHTQKTPKPHAESPPPHVDVDFCGFSYRTSKMSARNQSYCGILAHDGFAKQSNALPRKTANFHETTKNTRRSPRRASPIAVRRHDHLRMILPQFLCAPTTNPCCGHSASFAPFRCDACLARFVSAQYPCRVLELWSVHRMKFSTTAHLSSPAHAKPPASHRQHTSSALPS